MTPTIQLVYRRIDPAIDAELCLAHHQEACQISYGPGHAMPTQASYLPWLRERVEMYGDGHVLAFLDDGRCVGQLELEVPYGSETGYVDLFYVTPQFRGMGFGRMLNDYVERYFRSWEAREIELHVARTNTGALEFYRRLGYRYAPPDTRGNGLWRMIKALG